MGLDGGSVLVGLAGKEEGCDLDGAVGHGGGTIGRVGLAEGYGPRAGWLVVI